MPFLITISLYGFGIFYVMIPASLVAQSVKNPPAMQETWVQALGWENPREKGMATHSSILGENSMDRGAWWTIVLGVIKSQTRLSD